MPEVYRERFKPTEERMSPHGKGGGGHRRGAPRIQPQATPSGSTFSRGRLIGLGAAGAVGFGLLYLGAQSSSERPPATPTPRSTEPPRAQEPKPMTVEFSGEVGQTRDILQKLIGELAQKPNDKEKYIHTIRDLAIAYLSKQMTEMFPDRAEQYRREKLQNAFIFPSEDEFIKRHNESNCVDRTPNGVPAFSDTIAGKTYIQPQRFLKLKSGAKEFVHEMFSTFIHESLHITPILIVHNPPTQVFGLPRPILSQKGLSLIARHEENSRRLNRECIGAYKKDVEELIVEDATFELVNKVGIQMGDIDSAYKGALEPYRLEIRSQYPNGDFKELLGYQQASDYIGFLTSLGKTIAKEQDPQQQLSRGLLVESRMQVLMVGRVPQ